MGRSLASTSARELSHTITITTLTPRNAHGPGGMVIFRRTFTNGGLKHGKCHHTPCGWQVSELSLRVVFRLL